MEFIEVNPVKTEAPEGKASRICRGCLETKGKLFELCGHSLDKVFAELTGQQVYGGHLCYICAHLLQKFREFRVRCLNSSYILQQVETLNDNINSIDRTKLQYNLATSDILNINYDPCPKKDDSPTPPKRTRRKTAKATNNKDNSKKTVDLSDIEIETNLNNEGFFTNVNTADSFLESLNEVTQLNDNPKTNDDTEVNETKDFDDENNDSETNFDDFAWPDNKGDLKSNVVIIKPEIGQDDDDDDKPLKLKKSPKKEAKVKTKSRKRKADLNKVLSEYLSDQSKHSETLEKKVHSAVNQEIAKLYAHIHSEVKENGGDYYEMFERIYKESAEHMVEVDPEELDDDDQIPSKKYIWEFLSLHKQMENICSLKIEFLSVEKQLQEMEEKRSSGKYEEGYCQLCIRKFNHMDTLQRHVNLKHNASFKSNCRICLCRFKREKQLLEHLLINHSQRVTCAICGVYIQSVAWYRLMEHQKLHDGTKFACQFCDKSFKYYKLRAMHIRQVHRNKMDVVVCLLCGDTYNGPQGLQNHTTRMHREAVRCKTCKAFFATADALSNHRKDDGCVVGHSSCSICGANFPTTQLMMTHYDQQCSIPYVKKKRVQGKTNTPAERSYVKKRLYIKQDITCEVCGKSGFYNTTFLKYHQRIHTGEKPYKCEVCEKSFRMGPTLKIHMRTHTHERRYQCDYCPAAFKQIAHLKSHLPSHTKEKIHGCDICEKTFAHRGSLVEHKRTIHEGLPSKHKKPNKRPNKYY